MPIPAIKVPNIADIRRSSTEKQSTRTRSTPRYSQQESISIKSQQPNIIETYENGLATYEETDSDNIGQMLEDETSAGSTDCSVM